LKEEALDRTMWRNRFGRGFGPVVRQNTERIIELINSNIKLVPGKLIESVRNTSIFVLRIKRRFYIHMDFVLILMVLSTVVIPSTFSINDITFLNPSGQAILWYTVSLYSFNCLDFIAEIECLLRGTG